VCGCCVGVRGWFALFVNAGWVKKVVFSGGNDGCCLCGYCSIIMVVCELLCVSGAMWVCMCILLVGWLVGARFGFGGLFGVGV